MDGFDCLADLNKPAVELLGRRIRRIVKRLAVNPFAQ